MNHDDAVGCECVAATEDDDDDDVDAVIQDQS